MVDLTCSSLGAECALDDQEYEQILEARKRILSMAEELDMTVEQLTGDLIKEERRRAIKYRDRVDCTKQWSGIGRQPKWVKEWIANGGALDQLRVE